MKFTSIISKEIVPKMLGNLGNCIPSALCNSPLPSLLKPLLEYKNIIDSEISGYDAFNTAIIYNDSLQNFNAEHLAKDQQVPDAFIEIDESEASAMHTGFSQAREFLGNAAGVIQATSAAGVPYCFKIGSGISTETPITATLISNITAKGEEVILKQINGRFFLKPYVYGMNYLPLNLLPDHDASLSTIKDCACYMYESVVNDGANLDSLDVHNILTLICNKLDITIETNTLSALCSLLVNYYQTSASGEIHSDLKGICDILPDPNAKYSPLLIENTLSFVNGLVTNTEILSLLSQTISALTRNAKEFFTSLNARLGEFKAAVKRVALLIYNGWCNGGLKGAINVLFAIIKQTSSIRDSDGFMEFTDNRSFMPTEYIAGLVVTVVSAVVTIVGMLLNIIQPIVGAIVAAVGAVMWSILGSFNADVSSTRAQINTNLLDDESIAFLGCAPISLFRGEFNIQQIPSLRRLFASGNLAYYIDVPGGIIIFGASAISENSEVTDVRWEFHSSTDFYNPSWFYSYLSRQDPRYLVSNGSRYMGINLSWTAHLSGSKIISDAWNARHTMYSDLFYDMCNEAGGSLSDTNDYRAFNCTVAYITIFLLWIVLQDDRYLSEFLHADLSDPLITDSLNLSWWNDVTGVAWIWQQGMWALSSQAANKDWTKLISCLASLGDSDNEVLGYHAYSDTPSRASDLTYCIYPANPTFGKTIFTNKLYYGTPYELSGKFEYSLNMPRFNGKTFWKWIALASLAVVAVTVTAVIGATKFMKWKKRKLADNVAKFNDAQSTYHSAVNGEKQTYNEATKQYEIERFDVNSAEGKAYIQSCFKDYKTVAFKNNLWANIIGGTRYDVTTFYGQAEEDDTPTGQQSVSEQVSGIYESYSDLTSRGNLKNLDCATETNDISTSILYNVLTGREFRM